nr:hypothetical transcript [Hymenolepis microstoma]
MFYYSWLSLVGVCFYFAKVFSVSTNCTETLEIQNPTLLQASETTLTWRFDPIDPKDNDWTYEVRDLNKSEWIKCDLISRNCEAKKLSPGTTYSYYFYACSQTRDCCINTELCKETTIPQNPRNISVDPTTSTSVTVTFTPPEDTTGIVSYIAEIEAFSSCFCTSTEAQPVKSCTIVDLSPATNYSVNAKSCLGGEFSSTCSDVIQGSGWTKPLPINMKLIVALVVVCIILVLLIILVIVFWKRIKSLRRINADVQDSKKINGFIINYVEPKEAYKSENMFTASS